MTQSGNSSETTETNERREQRVVVFPLTFYVWRRQRVFVFNFYSRTTRYEWVSLIVPKLTKLAGTPHRERVN